MQHIGMELSTLNLFKPSDGHYLTQRDPTSMEVIQSIKFPAFVSQMWCPTMKLLRKAARWLSKYKEHI